MPTPIALDLSQQEIPLRFIQTGGEVIFSTRGEPPVAPKFNWIKNVLPTKQGISTTREVAEYLAAAMPATVTFDLMTKFSLFLVWRDDGSSTYYLYNNGKHLILNLTPKVEWVEIKNSVTLEDYATTSYLHGKTWGYQTDEGMYTFGPNFATIVNEVMSGISIGSIKGITSTNNYLIAWSLDTIYWSDPTNPNEFAPTSGGAPTGAGSQKVQAVRSQIRRCLPTSEGFIIYTSVNAVSARYSGNSTNPWIFREIPNSGGITDDEHVSHSANTNFHIAWTSSGIQQITHDGAEVIFPNLTDFLAGTKFDRIDTDGYTIKEINTSNIAIKVVLVSSRYICFSYGESYEVKESIIVYDFVLKMWGRLITEHLDVVSYIEPEVTQGTLCSELLEPCTAYHSTKCNFWGTADRITTVEPSTIGILKPDGALNLIQFVLTDRAVAIDTFSAVGEIRFGDLKLTRESYCSLTEVKLIGEQDNNVEVSVITESASGKIPVPYTQDPNNVERYVGSNNGENHTLRITGSFNLANIIVTLNQTGSK